MRNSETPRRLFSAIRIWDVLASAVIALALWKVFVAPRLLAAPHALPAPHAVFSRLDGGAFRLAQQRGRVVFLDFYASWCAPCRLALPLVEAWRNGHPGALVVPVDVGEPRASAQAFARRLNLRGVALDPTASARALFGVGGFPTVVAVDPDGYIRARWEGLNPAIGLALSNAQDRLSLRQ